MTLSNVPTYLKKRSKPFIESFGTKQFCKSSYTISEGPRKERCGEWTKEKINASWSKITSISKWTSSMKGRKSTSINGWRRCRILMVSLHGATCALKANACIAQAYSPTWTKAHAWRNHANGSGVGFEVNSKQLQESNMNVLIVCSSCNVS